MSIQRCCRLFWRALCVLPVLVLLVSCGTTKLNTTPGVVLPPDAWGIVPFMNNSGTPQAGHKAATITAALLRAEGVHTLKMYHSNRHCNKVMVCMNYRPPMRRLLAWAHRRHIRYLVLGSVNEWRYKVGLDGEPAVNVTIKIKDIHTGQVVWSAVGSKTGSSRSGLGVIAQRLIAMLLNPLDIRPQNIPQN